MTLSRSGQNPPISIPFYHCIGQYVTRSFVCADSIASQHPFEQHGHLTTAALAKLSSIFAVTVCAYAVMHNYYHLVLSVDYDAAKSWSDTDVLDRWCQLFPSPLLVQRFRNGELLMDAENLMVADRIKLYRSRLCDLSWFTRCLNENTFGKVNTHAGDKNRLWGTRFNTEILSSESAIISCMAYIDLTQVRAGVAKTLAQSDYTSAQQRIIQSDGTRRSKHQTGCFPELSSFEQNAKHNLNMPCSNSDYLGLIDWCCQTIQSKRRFLADNIQPAVLRNMDIDPTILTTYSNRIPKPFLHAPNEQPSIKLKLLEAMKFVLKSIPSANRLFAQVR